MKPAWDQLGDEFAGSKTVLIGDVDCTVEKDLCSKYGVRGYPTIKSFTGNPDGDPYEGGRDFAALKKFADESLGPSCSNDNIDLCDDDQKAILEKYNKMSFMLIDFIRKKEEEIEGAEGDSADKTPKRSDVINWYLEEQIDDITSQDELVEHKQIVEKVVDNLIYKDHVLVPITNNQQLKENETHDPFLVVHPNYVHHA